MVVYEAQIKNMTVAVFRVRVSMFMQQWRRTFSESELPPDWIGWILAALRERTQEQASTLKITWFLDKEFNPMPPGLDEAIGHGVVLSVAALQYDLNVVRVECWVFEEFVKWVLAPVQTWLDALEVERQKQSQSDIEDFSFSLVETEIAHLIAQGFQDGEIAKNRNLAISTARAHRRNIGEKVKTKYDTTLKSGDLRILLRQANYGG